MWQPYQIVVSERGNWIQVTLPEHGNTIPNHTLQSQTKVHHQDYTTRGNSWHTFIQLSLFTIRAINNATFAYIHSL